MPNYDVGAPMADGTIPWPSQRPLVEPWSGYPPVLPYSPSATGTTQYSPPAAASPSYSPPPTVRANWGVDWDAISRAFTSGIWGGASFAAGPGNPASYYQATPAYLQQQQAAMTSAIQTSTDFQKTMADQNARAAAAIAAAGASAADVFGRSLPVVIDPSSDIFRLQLPGPQASGGGGSMSKWGILAAVAAVGFVGWRWLSKRKASER